VLTNCDAIKFYGRFMKLLGVSDTKTGLMLASTSVDIELGGELDSPVAADAIFKRSGDGVSVDFSGFDSSGHNFGLLLFDSGGRPLCLNYAKETEVRFEGDRIVVTVQRAPGASRAWLMVDTGVAATSDLAHLP
jgi:hypothetical protein